MSREPEGSQKRSSRFFDAVQAISSSIRGPSTDSRLSTDATSSYKKDAPPLLVVNPSSSLPLDVFPTLTKEQLAKVLQLEDDEQNQVMAAYEESKLNWDLDPRLVGGHRSDANLGMARIFSILSQISIIDSHAGKADNITECTTESYIDADGNVVAAPSIQGGTGAISSSQNGYQSKDSNKEVFSKQFEIHDLLRAIDKKDTQLILTIRDSNFDLLLDLNQGGTGVGVGMGSGTVNTPLGYCIGLGKGWEGVAVVLTGALSKFINNLPDEEEDLRVDENNQKKMVKRTRRELDPRTLSRLRKLRTSLKLAIDHSIAIDQTRLLSSYLQVLLMSTGQTFIRETTNSVHQALLSHHSGSQVDSSGVIRSNVEPVQVAYQAITFFFTESLKTKAQTRDISQRIASVDDLIDNCVGDFLIMAIWQDIQLHQKELSRVSNEEMRINMLAKADDEQLLVELPTWSFARDDRIITIFTERIWNMVKVLDMIEWENANHPGTKSTKQTRHPRIWKCAKTIVEELSSQKKRLSSKERLSVLRSHVH